MVRINELLKGIKIEYIKGDQNIEIEGIRYDSRKIKKNDLFICVQGHKTDGHKYINDVIKKGAKAVVIDKEIERFDDNITYIKVRDSRKAMAYLAKNFFENPLEEIDLIGVTGTNGKTTTTYLIKEILNNSGYKTGLIGTIEIYDGKNSKPASRTTPESIDIYRELHKMRKNKVRYTVMEVSSHALALNRVDSMNFQAAVFTNLTQDHLDYHKTMREYASQKTKLFKKLKENGWAIINNDDQFAQLFKDATEGNIISYGIENPSDIKPSDIELSLKGVKFTLNNFHFNLKLTGKFNIYNSLASIGVAKTLGIKESLIRDSLENVQTIPGRFETLDLGQDFSVIIDYAHTPDSMINIIDAVKHFKHNDIIVVFGCGGERDKGKRPIMGEIAVKQGDYAVITTDNPRSEDPITIIKEIEKGIKEGDYSTPYEIKEDRKEAIFTAINRANKDDVVLIIGKGHETYQVFSDRTIDFNDKEVAASAIKRKRVSKDV